MKSIVMKRVNIINPVAGQGDAEKYVDKTIEAVQYVTRFASDAEQFSERTCKETPETQFYIYGGDGTVNEVVNGILRSGSTEKPVITPMATGTGNDFIRSCKGKGLLRCDAMRVNNGHALNVVNIGFDSIVAKRASEYKKLPAVSGSSAYILGVLTTLFNKLGEKLKIEFTDEKDARHTLTDNYLLCVIGNGRYYGGGFCAAPLADLDDGLLDIVVVKKMSRFRFISLVGPYKKGKHINPDGTVLDKFKDVMQFFRCKHIRVSNTKNVCVDGENIITDYVDISVMRKAINVEA